jgi:2-oxoacid:acceptor oxidoreductase delta subunit (pyruvate/2-ketoisovalerate family)
VIEMSYGLKKPLSSWKEMPPGVVVPAVPLGGKNMWYKTGNWRSLRPVVDKKKCTKCRICWLYCPDSAIQYELLEADLEYCKGCGICSRECPTKAITMISEMKFRPGE